MNLKLKIIGSRLCALIAAGALLVCAKESSKKNNSVKGQIGFYVSGSSGVKSESGMYSYIINKKGFRQDKIEHKNIISIAKSNGVRKYGDSSLEKRSCDWYKKNMKIILPDSFDNQNKDWFNCDDFDCGLECEELQDCLGDTYNIIRTKIILKKDIDNKFQTSDSMSSVAIYYKNNLVAYKQTGIGSECNNIKKSLIGNVDEAISTLYDYGILSNWKETTIEDICNYQEHLNNEKVYIKK